MSTFVITAGHSNTDPGAIGNGLTDAQVGTWMRNTVAAKLRERGHIVMTDGVGDVNKPLGQAIQLIQSSLICLEFHANAATSAAATGVETVAQPSKKAVAQKISSAISGALGLRLRGDKGWISAEQTARGKVGFVAKGGLIVELFFISNPDDVKAWEAKKWLAATAVVDVLGAT